MEKRFKVAEFAAVLGIVPKTVYKMIERDEVITVNELVNNRKTTVIITSDEQIEHFRKIYGKNTGNESNCYGNVTDNELFYTDNIGYSPVNNSSSAAYPAEVINRILELNEQHTEQLNSYNDRILSLNEELANAKAKTLLLEDKASREGLYLNEINGLKTVNKRLMNYLYSTIAVIILLLLCFTGYFTYNIAVNSRSTTEETSVTEQIQKKAGQVVIPARNSKEK